MSRRHRPKMTRAERRADMLLPRLLTTEEAQEIIRKGAIVAESLRQLKGKRA